MEEQNACEKRRKGVFHGCVVWGWASEVLGRGGSLDNSAGQFRRQHRPRERPLLPAATPELDDLSPCATQ